jgi:CheY-like chemotaxis protein
MPEIKKILLVEDNEKIVQIYQAVLEQAGYTVMTTMTGEKALEQITSFNPDLIFLDIMLPGVSGLQVLGSLRSEPQYNAIEKPIVMLTNLGEQDTVQMATDRAANKYVVKANITNEDLVQIVKSFE